jgi:hypothetical protein
MNPESPGWVEKLLRTSADRLASRRQTRALAAEAASLRVNAVNESRRSFNENIEDEFPKAFFKTQERFREIGLTRFEPLVLPQRTLLDNDPFWEGKIKPYRFFWQRLEYGMLKPESAILQKGVYLIDGRAKPDYDDGVQRYEDDEFIEDMMRKLRKNGDIETSRHVPRASRFDAAPYEIEVEILKALTDAVGKDALGEGKVINTPYIIFNVAGNMRHPEWGETDTSESFGDKFETRCRLFGGNYDVGGLAHVDYSASRDRRADRAFRPMIVFPLK